MPTTHKVKSGETLWSMSKQHLGAGHLWPSIYIHNNSPQVVRQRGKRLVDPNLIHPGDIIYLPPTGHGVPRLRISALPPGPAAASARAASTIAPSNRRDLATPSSQSNPAGRIMVPETAVKYVFPDQVLYTSEVPGWKITAKLAGSVTLQRTLKVPMVVYSNKGFEASVKQQANLALSQLTSDAKMSFDPAKGTVKFENSLTTRANADAPSTKVAFSMTPDGRLVGKASIGMPTLRGFVSQYTFVANDVSVEMEVEQQQINRRDFSAAPAVQTVPMTAPAAKLQGSTPRGTPPTRPSSGGAGGVPVGEIAMAGAVVLVGVMILQDFATAGVGIADNGALLGLAATMWSAGAAARTERQRLRPAA